MRVSNTTLVARVVATYERKIVSLCKGSRKKRFFLVARQPLPPLSGRATKIRQINPDPRHFTSGIRISIRTMVTPKNKVPYNGRACVNASLEKIVLLFNVFFSM